MKAKRTPKRALRKMQYEPLLYDDCASTAHYFNSVSALLSCSTWMSWPSSNATSNARRRHRGEDCPQTAMARFEYTQQTSGKACLRQKKTLKHAERVIRTVFHAK